MRLCLNHEFMFRINSKSLEVIIADFFHIRRIGHHEHLNGYEESLDVGVHGHGWTRSVDLLELLCFYKSL